jgi:rRNA maturation RNase YbeY
VVLAAASNWLKEQLFDADYELSVAFISAARSSELNHRFRGQNKPASVLSFPLSPSSGEILLNRAAAQAGAALRGEKLEKYLIYLLIHGLLHLKGYQHGSKMEASEKKFLQKYFQHHAQTHSRRPRHRHRRDPARRLRSQ